MQHLCYLKLGMAGLISPITGNNWFVIMAVIVTFLDGFVKRKKEGLLPLPYMKMLFDPLHKDLGGIVEFNCNLHFDKMEAVNISVLIRHPIYGHYLSGEISF
jgi:hypothetical protein